MSNAPLYSVVLSTYNRGALLVGAVESLLSLDAASPPHEVIVVDNNSRDNTREIVQGMIPGAGGRLRYVFEGKQGLSHGRNAGVAAARGQIIAFTDDDVRAAPDWLCALDRAFSAHPHVSFVGGKVLPLWSAPPPAWLTERHWGPLALVDYGREGFACSVERAVCLVGANMAYRREVFDEFGGFDPHYQHERGAVSAVEDHEFELRLYSAGRLGWYEPSAVIHAEVQLNRLTKAYHRKWHFDHGRAVVRMLREGHHFGRDGVPTPEPAGSRRVLDAPVTLYRALVRQGAGWARARLLGPEDAAFFAETEIRETLGAMHFYTTTRRRDPVRGFPSAAAPRIESYARAEPLAGAERR